MPKPPTSHIRKPRPGRSLAEVRPDLVAEWHSSRNGDLTPNDVEAGTHRKVWWRCPEGPDHEWQATCEMRVSRGRGCPFCAGKRASVTNSVASNPVLASQWHPTRNGDLTPDQIVAGTAKKLWWLCPAGSDHEWQATGASRSLSKSGCPFCAGQRASITNSLARFPELSAQLHPTRNGDLRPEDVAAGTRRKVWWQCPAGPDHVWHAPVAPRTKGIGCPFCRGVSVSVTNSLSTRFPDLAAQWHPTRNGELTPDNVVAGTMRKLWWKCPEGPDHEWQAPGSARVAGNGCPFCAGQRVSTTNSLSTRFPDLAAQWHPTRNGELTPDNVVAGTMRKLWWKCPEGPDHEWQAPGSARVAGNGCPFCRGFNASVTNSLARFPELVSQWHPTHNGDLHPDQVVASTKKKLWWQCPVGPDHEWQAIVRDRVRGVGCPFCAGQRASVTNSLARFPELAEQFHHSRNGNLTPDQVVAGTGKKLWWQCQAAPDHVWQARGAERLAGTGCPSCAEHGYNPGKPGAVYVLCGDRWGKVGISNVLAQRLKKHAAGGAFGPLIAAVQFNEGATPVHIERQLCELIANRSGERAAREVDGFTESFPAHLCAEVVDELHRLLDQVPRSEWSLLS